LNPALKEFAHIDCRQNFYPEMKKLEAAGYPYQEGLSYRYEMVLCALPKQAVEARYMLARALTVLEPGGSIAAAAANDAGASRIEGWMEEMGLVPQSLSKNKRRVAWA